MVKNCSKIAIIRLLAGETSQYRICEQNILFKILKLHITGYELVSNCYTSFEMLETDYFLNVGATMLENNPTMAVIGLSEGEKSHCGPTLNLDGLKLNIMFTQSYIVLYR